MAKLVCRHKNTGLTKIIRIGNRKDFDELYGDDWKIIENDHLLADAEQTVKQVKKSADDVGEGEPKEESHSFVDWKADQQDEQDKFDAAVAILESKGIEYNKRIKKLETLKKNHPEELKNI